MIAYLINLKRANDRLVSAKEAFDKAGINFNLEVAVDGKELSLPHQNYSELKYNLLHGKNTKEDLALICEDDIEFDENIIEIINGALRSGINFDLLRLSGGSNRNKEIGLPLKLKKIHNDFFLSLNFGFKSGTGCYLINRHAAKNIIIKIKNMSLPIDHAMDRDWILNIRSLSITPAPVYLKEELHLENSYIQADKEFKFPFYKRYWILAPYRLANELIRLFYKLFIFIKIKIES